MKVETPQTSLFPARFLSFPSLFINLLMSPQQQQQQQEGVLCVISIHVIHIYSDIYALGQTVTKQAGTVVEIN